MVEYIDREIAINLFYTVDPENDGTDGSTAIRKTANYSSEEIESMLSDLPPADVAPVRHAQWVARYDGLYECSSCKREALYKAVRDGFGNAYFEQVLSDSCPYCGAKMDGGEENAAD